MSKRPSTSNSLVLIGVFFMLVNTGMSFARLVIEILYYAKRSDSCEDMAQQDIKIDCSNDLNEHLFKEKGFNYIIFVSVTDALIIFLSTILIVKIRQQNIQNYLQYTYMIILIVSLIVVILSFDQQIKYLNSDQSIFLKHSCSKKDSNPGCDFYKIQKAYKNCLIPFPAVQIILSIIFKIYLERVLKQKKQAELQDQLVKKKMEETTVDFQVYNSRGKQYNVFELYNMGKN